jgi:hypothetical protein
MKKHFIYSLTCDGLVFYIGKTKDIKNRFYLHRKSAKFKRNYKERYINRILSENKSFEIDIIEEVEDGLENFREIYWISEYRKMGYNLCNTSNGGDGGDHWTGKTHSDETKKKLSAIRYKQIEEGMIFRLNGEKNGRSKLTDDKVIEMRKLCFQYGSMLSALQENDK